MAWYTMRRYAFAGLALILFVLALILSASHVDAQEDEYPVIRPPAAPYTDYATEEAKPSEEADTLLDKALDRLEPTPAPTPRPLNAQEKFTYYGSLPFALHQLPLTIPHELSHLGTLRLLGVKAGIHPIPHFHDNPWGGRTLVYSHVFLRTQEPLPQWKVTAVSLAPFVTRLLVVDRLFEAAYRNGWIQPRSFADRWALTTLRLELLEPIDKGFMGGDLRKLNEKKWVGLAASLALQVVYVESHRRIMRARDDDDGYFFYINIGF